MEINAAEWADSGVRIVNIDVAKGEGNMNVAVATERVSNSTEGGEVWGGMHLRWRQLHPAVRGCYTSDESDAFIAAAAAVAATFASVHAQLLLQLLLQIDIC